MNPKLIMVVDDESAHRLMLRAHLEETGYKVIEADSGAQALDKVKEGAPDLILLDLKMPGMDGLEVLDHLNRLGQSFPVVIMTAYSSIDSALRAGRLGIKHYLTKPLDTDDLLLKIQDALQTADAAVIQAKRERDLARKFDFQEILGRSPVMLDLKEMLSLVSPSEANVLITGESGTGKELIARAIHRNSPRKNKGFVAVNCAALPETLLESELFGHERGAFTGAHQRKIGRFEMADGGTLFLDEVGEMAPTTQAKLLRVLEEQAFERVGGTSTVKVDVRVLTATNRDLESEIAAGAFREDLYYRLNVVHVMAPGLRERGAEDVKELAYHLLEIAAKRNRRKVKGFTPKALKALIANPWPGNVRELVNAVERAVIMARSDEVDLEDLPLAVQSWVAGRKKETPGQGVSAGMTIKEVEAELIDRTLKETGGNRTKAASMLGITRQTLLNKIKEYNLA